MCLLHVLFMFNPFSKEGHKPQLPDSRDNFKTCVPVILLHVASCGSYNYQVESAKFDAHASFLSSVHRECHDDGEEVKCEVQGRR